MEQRALCSVADFFVNILFFYLDFTEISSPSFHMPQICVFMIEKKLLSMCRSPPGSRPSVKQQQLSINLLFGQWLRSS